MITKEGIIQNSHDSIDKYADKLLKLIHSSKRDDKAIKACQTLIQSNWKTILDQDKLSNNMEEIANAYILINPDIEKVLDKGLYDTKHPIRKYGPSAA